MRVTGTVSDFDATGGFGLIIADDGEFLPFSTREIHPVLHDNIGVGSRVRFSRQDGEPAARATQVAPIDDQNGRHNSPTATLQP
jgi:cold shock CspA family protein